MTRVRVWLGLVFCAWQCSGAAALAQGSAGDGGAGARAQAHFDRGQERFAARDFRGALVELQAAADLVPSAELWFDIGRAHEELGEGEAAIAAYERYLRDAVDAADRAQVAGRVARLAAEIDLGARAARPRTDGALRVVAPRGAVVLVDGVLVAEAPSEAPIALAAGSHRLDVVAPHAVPFRAQVQVRAGMLTSAYAELPPRVVTERASSSRAPAAAGVGLAVAALAATIVFVATAGSGE